MTPKVAVASQKATRRIPRQADGTYEHSARRRTVLALCICFISSVHDAFIHSQITHSLFRSFIDSVAYCLLPTADSLLKGGGIDWDGDTHKY